MTETPRRGRGAVTAALATGRELLRVHLRTIVPMGAVVVVGFVVLVVLTLAYAQIIGVTAYQGMVASINSVDSWSSTVVLIMAPIVLLAIFASLVWAGAATLSASSAVDKKGAWMPSAVWLSMRRAPKALAVIVVTLVVVLAAIIAAPVLLIIGIVGLLASRKRAVAISRERLIPMAIPFGVAVLIFTRWSLALPAVWIDGLGVRAALAESARRVTGRGPFVAIMVIVVVLVSGGLALLIALPFADPSIKLLVQVVALILIGALPVVALAVLYRRGSDERPAALAAPLSRRARIAAAVAVSLILPLFVAVLPGPAAVAASGTEVDLAQYATATSTGDAFQLQAVVAFAPSATGTVRLEAQPATGPAIDLGTYPLNSSSYVAPSVGSTLPAGDYQLVGYYSGDGTYPPGVSDPLAHTVSDPAVSFSVSSAAGASGDTATVTVTLAPVAPAVPTPAGSISINGGSAYPLNGSGVATIPVDVTALGTRVLTVAYSPASYYPAASTLYTVPRLATTLNVFGAAVRSVTYGDSQTFDGGVISATVPTGTVDLIGHLGNVIASATLSGGLFSITTTRLSVDDSYGVLQYNGDANHLASDNRGTPVVETIAHAVGTPVVSVSPSTSKVGDSDTLVATLPALGAGATGSVTFNLSTGGFLGTAPLVGGVAQLPWTPVDASTYVTATYAGDHNFSGATSDIQRIDADPAAVTVTIADPGPVSYGSVFSLNVHVQVGANAVRPSHTLDFVTSTGTVLAANVYVDASGNATKEFCARLTLCSSGDVLLGTTDLDIVARYGVSTVNDEAEATYSYRPSGAPTTTSLVVTPSPTILYGSGVDLKATVSATPGTTPTGSVTFSAVEPGGGLVFLASVPLTAGVAEWTTSAGNGAGRLVWPEDKVEALYSPSGAPFQSSSANVDFAISRVGTTLAVGVGTPVLNTPTTVTVTLSHDPGTNADYTGFVTMTSDTGATCTRYPASGAHSVSCPFTWTTAGSHKVTTSYSDADPVYLPIADADTAFSVGTTVHTPVLNANAPTAALVGEPVTVTWSLFDVTMTGDVTVTADGTPWCTVPVATLSCSGSFGNSSATGGFVDIHVSYPGDANFFGVDEVRHVSVTRCAVLDVRGNDSSLGSVHVDTAPNCGTSGYRPGTSVQVTATPTGTAQFDSWLGYLPPAPNLVLLATTTTTHFTVTTDTQTWVRVAQFRVACSAITANASGFGGISVYPASNCTTSDGVAGYRYGTVVSMYPDGHYDPVYDEPDAFRSFGTLLPAGATVVRDSSGRPYERLTVTGPTSVPVLFGPVCRTVSVLFSPATVGDAATFSPAPNCLSPLGNGYLRYTQVTAHSVSGDRTLAITGWTLNGAPAPQLGTTSDPVVAVDQVPPALVASVVHCYAVVADVDAVIDRNGLTTGEVRVDGTACPDGSGRYLGGTTVTLTPTVLTKGTLFNGWDEVRSKAVGPSSGDTGDVTEAALTFTLLADIHKTAGFFDQSACSTLMNIGSPGLLTFDDSGCGPGYYFDFRKQQASIQGVDASTLVGDKWNSVLQTEVHKPGGDNALNVYVSIHGDSPDCGKSPQDQDGFAYLGAKTGTVPCHVSGPVQVDASVCQPLTTAPTFTVAGRPGASYGADSMPGTFYISGPDGIVRPSSSFSFGRAVPVVQQLGGQYALAAVSGPCAAVPNLFAPNTDVLLYASAPASGFAFTGWTDGGTTPNTDSPVHKLTTATEKTLSTSASFTVTCTTVTFGEGIHIIGDAPRCPGSSESDNSFIVGTSIAVRADYQLGNRYIQKFTSGVGANQIGQDPATLDWNGFVNVAVGTKVSALYQSTADLNKTAIVTGLKFGVGVLAVMAPVVLGAVFPPAGILFAAVGAMAGIASFIPGGQKAEAVFDLVNPTKITACIARWGFENTGHPDGHNIGAIIKTAKTGLTEAKDALTPVVETEEALTKGTSFAAGAGKVAGGAASIGYGLYSAGIGDAITPTPPKTVEELAGTSTIAGCLDNEWRITGVHLPGSG